MSRQLCPHHPTVDYKTAWGCPECLTELREKYRCKCAADEQFAMALTKAQTQIEALTHDRDSWIQNSKVLGEDYVKLEKELAATKARLEVAREALDWIVTGTMIDTTPLGATDVTMGRVIDRCNQFARETLDKLDAPPVADQYMPSGHHIVEDADGSRYVKNPAPPTDTRIEALERKIKEMHYARNRMANAFNRFRAAITQEDKTDAAEAFWAADADCDAAGR